jgi:putative oxidoreductase
MMNGLKQYADVGHLVLRLVIAAIFLYHGYQKWGLWSAVPEGMPSGMLNLMKFLSIVEPLGGLAMILGLWTRLAALGLGIIMVGAIYMKAATMGVGFATPQGPGWEFDLMILAGCIALLFEGAGKYSMDAMMKKGSM